MSPTIAAPNQRKNVARVLSAYSEISRGDFESMLDTFSKFLGPMCCTDSIFCRAYVLATTTDVFLIETTDQRFFVANERN